MNEITSENSITACPHSAPPINTWKISFGRCCAKISSINFATPIAIPLGFITTALPTASAGAAFQVGIAIGKFHGVINPATP